MPGWGSLRRTRAALYASIGAAVIVGLLVPTIVAPWSPVLHTLCAPTGRPVDSFSLWVPAGIGSAPYGGVVFNNATVPSGPLSAFPFGEVIYGIGFSNGSIRWAGFGALWNVTALANVTEWGPGANSPCTAQYSFALSFWGGIVSGAPIVGDGNQTVPQANRTLGMTPFPGELNLTVETGFAVANLPPISTCGTSQIWTPTIQTFGIRVTVPLTVAGRTVSIPYTLPFDETYRYQFPANFGTWQVENNSAPGGPGGGWAFSYSPCG